LLAWECLIGLSIFIVTVASIFMTFSVFGNGGGQKINKQDKKAQN